MDDASAPAVEAALQPDDAPAAPPPEALADQPREEQVSAARARMAPYIRTGNLSRALESCIQAWVRARPHELAAFRQHMQFMRDCKLNDKALTQERLFLHKGEIPNALHTVIAQLVDKDWLIVPECRNEFFRLFRIGCLNKNSESQR